MLRQALMIAARLAEVAARARQEHLAQARAESERAGRELTARFEAERAASRSSLAPVRADSWWGEADPERIGAAYKTAASWAGQDAEIAQTLARMDEQLAARGVHVTASMPERVDDLLRSRAWAAEHDPFMDGAFTREMAHARTPAERDRLNTALVSAWLASPEGHRARATTRGTMLDGQPKGKLAQATDWVRENAPEYYEAWSEDGRDIDTRDGSASHRRDIVAYWERHRDDSTGPAAAHLAIVEAGKLARDADREADNAVGHRIDGDKAEGRSQDSADVEQDRPSPAEPPWIAAQERDCEETAAHYEWDTAERREEFASSLKGKADQAAVDARVLADLSQGTHPRQAVAAAPRNVPVGRPDNASTRRTDLRKGAR